MRPVQIVDLFPSLQSIYKTSKDIVYVSKDKTSMELPSPKSVSFS